MAIDVYVTSFNIGTGAAGSTVSITPNFQTIFGLVFGSGRTASTDGNGAGTHLRFMGYFGAAPQDVIFSHGVGSRSVDAGGNGVADSSLRDDACIIEQGDGAVVGYADVQAISSTQVTFEVLDQFTTDLRVTVICFGGSDVTVVEAGAFTATGTAPVDQSVSTGNEINTVFVLSIGGGTAAPTTLVDSHVMLGIGNAAGETCVFAGASNDGSTSMVTESYLREGDLIATYNAGVTGVNNRATWVNATNGAGGSGFTFNWAVRNSSARFLYMAVSGTFQTKIGSFLTQTNTSTDMTGSTSFTPKGMMFLSHNKAQNSAGGLSAHDKWSMGVATGTSAQHCQAIADRDANTNAFVSMALEQDHIYVNMDEVNRTLQGSANLTAVGGSGFTARMTDADPAQGSVCWLALGDAAVVTKSLPVFNNRPRIYSSRKVM